MNRREQAERVGQALSPSRLHPAVLRFASSRRAAGPWAVAFSGGADSLALLCALWTHWPEKRDRLVALHFNHRLRGRAADADARSCRDWCRALGVKLVIGRWSRPTSRASEADSRAARHAFFAQTMRRARSRVLWLAHQRDDVAESMLMRLARGSGAGGLAAPRPVQVASDRRIHLRPLLTMAKSDLTEALRGARVAWREDGSNRSDDHFRNRVRHRVLPAWQKAAGRDAVAGAALSRELIEEDDAALESWVDRTGAVQRRTLRLGALQDLPRAVVRRALRRWLLAVRPDTDLSRAGFELLLAAVEKGHATRFSLGRRGWAVIRRDELTFLRAD